MRAPTINLASRPFRNNTVYYLVFVSCFIALLVASVYNLSDFLGRSGDLGTLRHQLAEGQREYQKLYQDVERMKREISKVNLSLLSQKSAFVNGLILSRFFSWSLLFDRFEDLIPLDVKIRSIRPAISPKEIQIQIDGLAKKAENLYQFEANLSDSEYFSGVYPVSENTRESRNAINFELVMNYLPAGKSGAGASPPTPTAGLPATGESQPQEGGPDQQPDQPAGPAASASTGEPASAPAEQPGSGVKAPPAASARAGQPGNAASVPPAATAAPPKAPAQDAVSRPQAAPARAGQPGNAASVPPAATA
ncbi:MAG: PilN domain-containing protein, partial [Acidobacteriota bacterium]